MGLQPVVLMTGENEYVIPDAMEVMAKNDGLSLEDFKAWFPGDFEGAIIHFTDFRY